ncbi:DUF5020 family protein [Flavobacterium granuli]|uniref:DUF5020 domain-containing protein n=1 Tax=Flavobacterium granuli TaxID=280093 RepID=A0ABU1S637_9FLAO|nr:DUF5020 family protein [Flavobacterium granuli]MDR6846506.1 hypothetical protein [Flavobacterium granuli]
MKIKLLLIALLFSFFARAQEVQLHYDFLPEREYFTFTFEFFKPDKLGSTFFFTDFNFGRSDSANLAYFEIARKFNIKNNLIEGLNFHIEYNDGLLMTDDKADSPENPLGFPINRAFLVGLGFPIKIGNFTLNTTYLYKNTHGSSGFDGQFTAVWFQNLFNNKVTFRGFLDFWSEDRADGSSKKAILLTEPQVLYNFNKSFSMGSEIEISNNFDPSEEFKVFPTIMAKYAF